MNVTVLLIAAGVMCLLGAALGVVIGVFVRLFKVAGDPLADLALELLPGANCGGCGYAGCADFARALAAGRAQPSGCPVSSVEQIAAISKALGVDAGAVERRYAVVACRSEIGEVRHMNYNGVQDCAAANLVAGGPQDCRYGCLGLGTCARRCPFGAIEIIGQVAVVHRELCVGCGKCEAACPRGVIRMVPADAEYHVYCNSPEKGAVKRQFCKAGCIGCRKCERVNPGMFRIDGFLSRVDYASDPLPDAETIGKIGCPVGCLMTPETRLEAARVKVEGKKDDQ